MIDDMEPRKSAGAAARALLRPKPQDGYALAAHEDGMRANLIALLASCEEAARFDTTSRRGLFGANGLSDDEAGRVLDTLAFPEERPGFSFPPVPWISLGIWAAKMLIKLLRKKVA